jgi:Fe-Mn family superoxide dismutase
MNISFKFEGVKATEKQKNLLKTFVNFLKGKYPLKNDITIEFLNDRKDNMTTGQRKSDGRLLVLVNGRLNRDILKTISHEWVHEYQMTIKKRKFTGRIGGKNEDEANALSGTLQKQFEKEHPEKETIVFKPFQKKIEELENALNEESPLKRQIITEIKKISIEKLPYDFDSLEGFIDGETMKTHYTKHYKGYVDKLNVELEKVKGKDMDLEDIITKISKFNTKVKNNGGGAFNHALFWKMLSPKKQTIKDPIKKEIEKNFGSFEKFKEKFEEESKNRFGSGWVWLILTDKNRLKIVSTSNQDNPLMNTEKERGYPLLGLDVWEHAYYLKYKNQRDKYTSNFWKVVNWGFVNDLYDTQIKRNKY